MVQADGTYQCVAPSGVACAGAADLDACSFTWKATPSTVRVGVRVLKIAPFSATTVQTATASVRQPVWLEPRAPITSVSQAVPSADNTCPTGTHEMQQADGTYQCVAPSGVACAGEADLASCSYTWGDNTVTGTCYQGACLEDCTAAGNNCPNSNSICQATGSIGATGTDYVCIPSNQFAADNTCPSEPMRLRRPMALTSVWHRVRWPVPARAI